MATKSKELLKPKAPVRHLTPEQRSPAPELHRAPAGGNSPIMRARMIGAMQHSVGNAHISRMVGDEPRPPKTDAGRTIVDDTRHLDHSQKVQCSPLKVSSPSDPSEREAEHTSKKIMRMPAPEAPAAVSPTPPGRAMRVPLVQRMADRTAQRSEAIARKQHGHESAGPDVAAEINASQSGGNPLQPALRGFMEIRFRANFEKVRVHVDDRAAKLCRKLGARAFAIGHQIFFGRGQYQPDSADGRELIAHELTHTIQQGAAVQHGPAQQGAAAKQGGTIQRSLPAPVGERAEKHVQRFGVSDALNYFADKANIIPGFRMFTIVLGVNPINMSKVDPSPANILRAVIEFMPGGGLITQALDGYGVFEKAGSFISKQIATLGMTGGVIKAAISQFLDSLGWSDILDLGGVWERAKRIFTEPIDRIKAFVVGLVTAIVDLIKDAILKPIAGLASKTRGWDLLTAVLGKDPITGDEVPQTAETLIGGFMKLIGQEEIWENLKKSNAVPRAWAWFQTALKELLGFVRQIPTIFINALKSLTIVDIVVLPMAFAKVAFAFADFIVKFTTWAGETIWKLLEIIFDVVSPGAWSYIKKTGAALKSILKNPLPFVGNLVKAAKLGFQNFGNNFLTHLKAGLINWLTGSLPGVYIPKAFTLPEIVKFVFSVLGLSWANIRAKLVKATSETAVKAMETGFDIVVTLVKDGPAAAWDKIKEQLSDLKDKVIGGISDFVVDMVVKKAIPKFIAMFIPGAGFISAILSIYDSIMVFVNKLKEIMAVVKGFIDSIVAIAAGNITAAAAKVESILAGVLSLAINFLAGFVGLGKVSDKVMGVIQKVRDVIDKALDWLIGWIVKTAKSLFAKATGKDKPDARTDEEKKADLDKAISEAEAVQSDPKATDKSVRKGLDGIKSKYKMQSLELVVDSEDDAAETVHVEGEINPKSKTKPAKLNKDGTIGSLGITRKMLSWDDAIKEKFEKSALWKLKQATVGDYVGAELDIRHKISISDTISHIDDSIKGLTVSQAVALLTQKGYPPDTKTKNVKQSIIDAARKLLQDANNDPNNLELGDARPNRGRGKRYDPGDAGDARDPKHDEQKSEFIATWGLEKVTFKITIERKSKKRKTEHEVEEWE